LEIWVFCTAPIYSNPQKEFVVCFFLVFFFLWGAEDQLWPKALSLSDLYSGSKWKITADIFMCVTSVDGEVNDN